MVFLTNRPMFSTTVVRSLPFFRTKLNLLDKKNLPYPFFFINLMEVIFIRGCKKLFFFICVQHRPIFISISDETKGHIHRFKYWRSEPIIKIFRQRNSDEPSTTYKGVWIRDWMKQFVQLVKKKVVIDWSPVPCDSHCQRTRKDTTLQRNTESHQGSSPYLGKR